MAEVKGRQYGAAKLRAKRIARAVARADRTSERRNLRELQDMRTRQRRFLALQIGLMVLNELEDARCFSIRDYTRIQPRNVMHAWSSEFGGKPPRKRPS